MRPMPTPPEKRRYAGFLAAVAIGWVVLAAAGMVYARAKNIPAWAAIPLLGAFLAEYPFYLVPAFPELRERLRGRVLLLYLLISAVVPYLITCLGAAEFQWLSFVRVAALALAMGLWYVVLPAVAVVDLLFLAMVAAVLIGDYFPALWVPRWPLKGQLAVLGHVILIQMAVVILMVARRVRETGYGFLPTAREWRIGALHFLYFVPIGFPLGLAIQAIGLRATPAPLWSIPATILGFLWVIALSEEFFFRGVLQQWIEDWTGSRARALILASVAFGSVHIWFGGPSRFPNWRWFLLASILGWCCGHARNQAGGIRAAVVTHSLVVATWRAFFA